MVRLIAAAALILIAVAARAQPIPPVEFTGLSLKDAVQESIRTKKLLIVYPRNGSAANRLMDATTWKNPTLAAWVMWHAIAIKVDHKENPSEYALLQREVGRAVPMGAFPFVLFFRDGKLAGMYPDPRFQGFLYEFGMFGPPDAEVFYPKATQLLFHLDLLMDKLRSIEPIWFMAHELANPMPEAPAYVPLWNVEDANAPAAAEPAEGEDIFTILRRARERVAAKEYFDATGLYTWLYERGPEVEPSLRTARPFLLAEMADLAAKREGSKQRFMDIRAHLEARQPWWDYEELLDWMMLSAALGQSEQSALYLAAYLIDDQEATMIPAADHAGLSILESLDLESPPTRVAKDAMDRLRTRAARLRTAIRPPGKMTDEEWGDLTRLRARVLLDEACRLYAALLLRGDEGRATEVARVLLGARDDGAARLGLVMAARVAGAPVRPEQRVWLREAAAMGALSPALERQLASESGQGDR